jgi:methylenetetrahydrofolate reductase (NADPH)
LTPDPEPRPFDLSVEVVPPAGPSAQATLLHLKEISGLAIDRFSVATNPLARPRMSALALCSLIQQQTDKPATLHVTTRDHNRLSTQSLLWGARALDIDSVLIATGDYVALGERVRTSTVRDLDVYDLVRMARESKLHTGVVLDPRPEANRLAHEVRRLEHKVEAGAQYAITQPVFDEAGARKLRDATAHLDIAIILGILPLRTLRHAQFLDQKVAGIQVPFHVQERLDRVADPTAEGLAMGREMLWIAREWFGGACMMPPFGHYEVVPAILGQG